MVKQDTHTHTQIYTHTHRVEYYSAIKKNEIMPFTAPQMDLEFIILGGVSQTEKENYHDIIYMWNQKNNTNNLFIK